MLAQTGLLLPTTPKTAVRAHAAQVGRSPDKGNGLTHRAICGQVCSRETTDGDSRCWSRLHISWSGRMRIRQAAAGMHSSGAWD